MAKKGKKQQQQNRSAPPSSTRTNKDNAAASLSAAAGKTRGDDDDTNPLYTKQRTFLQSLTDTERDSFFNDDTNDDEPGISPNRRAELWSAQADLGEACVNRYAWATPDARAVSILVHFSPLVEIGSGANAYWCHQMMYNNKTSANSSNRKTIDVVGYDVAPDHGGRTTGPPPPESKKLKTYKNSNSSSTEPLSFRVQRGGPEVLREEGNRHRTLFLCYPDEMEESVDKEETNNNDDPDEDTEEPPFSLAAECLKHYTGDILIHVGELIATGSLCGGDQAPWGRSSAPTFQEQLLAQFHCILSLRLQNWLHTSDCLTVWKRSRTTTIVFRGDDEDEDDDEDEEVEYRHIPPNEQLPVDLAAPCLQHLLDAEMSNPTTSAEQTQLRRAPDENSRTIRETATPSPASADASSPTTSTKGTRKQSKRRRQNTQEDTTRTLSSKSFDGNPSKEEYVCPW